MTSRAAMLLALILGGSGIDCSRPQSTVKNDERVMPDLTPVYRADKELQAALSTNLSIPELEKLTVPLKAEASILKDQVSADPTLKAFIPVVDKYIQIERAYEGYEQRWKALRQHMGCILRAGADKGSESDCDRRYGPLDRAQQQNLKAVGIECDTDGPCEEFQSQIVAMETEATRMYMDLARSKAAKQFY